MTRDRWLDRRVVAWALYDVAASPYAALVPTFFGLYFLSVIGASTPAASTQWGAAASLSLVVAGLLAPIFGALADARAWRLGVIAGATLLFALAMIAMAWIGPGDRAAAIALFVVAQVGYTLATSTYDSLLYDVARPEHAGRVSGFGWALGFVGGAAALGIGLAIVRSVPPAEQAAALARVFAGGGVLAALIALPVLAALRRMLSERPPAPYPVRAPSLRAVVGTLLRWREHREAFRLLLGFYLVNDALVTLVFFVTILFQNRYGLSVEGLLWLVLLYHVVALPATFWFSRLSDRWDKRRTLYALIAILCAAVLLLAFWNAPQAPLTVVVLLALVFGSLQAVCRALLMLLAPAARRSEFYGFNAVSGRLSAALGPISFGAVAAATGSQQAGLMLLVAFLLAGAAVLARLRFPAPE